MKGVFSKYLLPAVLSILFLSIYSQSLYAVEKCDRACLRGFLDVYLEALIARDHSRLPVSKDVRCTENTVEVKLGEREISPRFFDWAPVIRSPAFSIDGSRVFFAACALGDVGDSKRFEVLGQAESEGTRQGWLATLEEERYRPYRIELEMGRYERSLSYLEERGRPGGERCSGRKQCGYLTGVCQAHRSAAGISGQRPDHVRRRYHTPGAVESGEVVAIHGVARHPESEWK